MKSRHVLESIIHKDPNFALKIFNAGCVSEIEYMKITISFTSPMSKMWKPLMNQDIRGDIRPDIRKAFFTMRVLKHWHRLPRELVDTPSLETFKVRLNGALSNLI